MYDRMTLAGYNACVTPKVQGAVNLHEALKNTPLDFFVMTSSISAVLGNPGQANYCAANSYLDALAWYRNQQGLAATSLALPMVLDVGVVAENHDIEVSLSRKGMYGIDEKDMLRGFETAMMQPLPRPGAASIGEAQIIMGTEASALANALANHDTADAYWYKDSRFITLRAAVDAAKSSSSGRGRSGGDFDGVLKDALAVSVEKAIEVIAQHIVKRCSSILLTPVEDFELDDRSVASYGLDSMIGAELRNWLFKEFGLDIGFQQLLAPSLTLRLLATTVATTRGLLSTDGS